MIVFFSSLNTFHSFLAYTWWRAVRRIAAWSTSVGSKRSIARRCRATCGPLGWSDDARTRTGSCRNKHATATASSALSASNDNYIGSFRFVPHLLLFFVCFLFIYKVLFLLIDKILNYNFSGVGMPYAVGPYSFVHPHHPMPPFGGPLPPHGVAMSHPPPHMQMYHASFPPHPGHPQHPPHAQLPHHPPPTNQPPAVPQYYPPQTAVTTVNMHPPPAGHHMFALQQSMPVNVSI